MRTDPPPSRISAARLQLIPLLLPLDVEPLVEPVPVPPLDVELPVEPVPVPPLDVEPPVEPVPPLDEPPLVLPELPEPVAPLDAPEPVEVPEELPLDVPLGRLLDAEPPVDPLPPLDAPELFPELVPVAVWQRPATQLCPARQSPSVLHEIDQPTALKSQQPATISRHEAPGTSLTT